MAEENDKTGVRAAAASEAGLEPGQQTHRGQAPRIKHRFIQQPAPPEDSFADGAHGVTMGRNVLKLDLYRVVGYDNERKEELRSISHRLVLPMTAVPELIGLLQGVVQAVQRAGKQQEAHRGQNDKPSGSD